MLSRSDSLKLVCWHLLAAHFVDLSTELPSYDAADLIALVPLERYDGLKSRARSDARSGSS
jgi:hypothetical protein